MILNRRLGPYVTLSRIGIGGMAELFLGIKLGPGPFEKLVVLKCILQEFNNNDDYIRLFYHEANLTGLLNHPNIVHVYDVDIANGRHYMAMEHMFGVTVEELLLRADERDLPLPLEYALKLIIEVCEGMHYVHTLTDANNRPLGIVHRDLSPHNIFVTFDGVAKVFDFGIAQTHAGHAITHRQVAGKYAYMSPEQARGESIDARSDVFTLGILLFELTTHQRLFKRDTQVQTLRAITELPITSPSKVAKRYPRYLERIVMRALEREPDHRFADALEMCEELRKFLKISGAKPTSHLVSAYTRQLFTDEISAFHKFVLHARAEVESVHGHRDLDLAEASPPSVEITIDDSIELTPTADPSRIISIDTLEAAARGESATPNPTTAPDDQAIPPPTVDTSQLQRLRAMLIGAMLLLMGLVAVIVVLMLDSSVPADAPTTTPPTPSSTAAGAPADEDGQQAVWTVTLSSTPPGATISVNGARHASLTPTTLTLPSDQPVALELQRDGHMPWTHRIASAPPGAVWTIDAQLPAIPAPPEPAKVDVSPASPPTVDIELITQPDEAALSLDGQAHPDTTPLTLSIPLDPKQEHVALVNHPAFPTQVIPFVIDSENPDAIHIKLPGQPRDADALSEVVIDTWPNGARVDINGRYAGTTPLPPLRFDERDTVDLRISAPGYRAFTHRFELDKRRRVHVYTQLVPARDDTPLAVIDFRSDPVAELSIDGQPYGETPIDVLALPEGDHDFVLTGAKTGFRYALTQRIRSQRRVQTLEVEIPRGALKIKSRLRKLRVSLNGIDQGGGGRRHLFEPLVGTYTVRIEADGHPPFETPVTISERKTSRISYPQ